MNIGECTLCPYFITHTHGFIDPAELLRLIEEAIGNYRNCPSVTPLGHRMLILNAVLDYLKGDPKPLKKLAGEE